ncbi:DUF6941 family protein [Sedimentisphaera salicampi]|uniref:DUF6941 family protein n=1 Tax=Sedimentisphaera salicampi TaxID=1941349 RepID=UPI000B9CEC3F|nr:hypothetical protein [Sedimentisphaera salicampi]OXU14190.1 hypothetical protein SMSP1_01956 [Sedimentisphaera salicampi]
MSEVPPVMLSAITCDRVIFDRISGMPSIINIVQIVNSVNFPLRHSELVFFCELTNGHGQTEIEIVLVDLEEDDKILFNQKKTVEFRDVRHILTLALKMQGVVFPEPGEYRFQIYANGTMLGERRIVCRKVEKPPQKDADGGVSF